MGTSPQPRRRASDHQWINVRENWYRDVWLVVITVVMILLLFKIGSALDQIQQSRAALCQAQNLRRTRTLHQLDVELHRYERHATPAQRSQAQASKASSVRLIGQLAPHQNCIQVVHRTHLGR